MSWLRKRARMVAYRAAFETENEQTESIEILCREYAERALRALSDRERLIAGGHDVAKLDRRITEALVAAEADDE